MAEYLVLTAEIIDAAEAHRIGLVERLVPAEELMEVAEKTIRTIMSKAPIAVATAISAINNGFDMDMKSASTFEIETFTAAFASEDKKEGMTAFLEKRPAEFKNR